MRADSKKQVVLSHDDSILVSNGQQSHVTSARQISMKLTHPNIT